MSDIEEVDAFSVPLFCARHSISRATFYNLIDRGEAPDFMRVGTRILVSREAAEAWRRRCEAAAPARGRKKGAA